MFRRKFLNSVIRLVLLTKEQPRAIQCPICQPFLHFSVPLFLNCFFLYFTLLSFCPFACMSVCLHFSISLLNESVAHIFLVLTGFLTLIDLLSICYSPSEIILALIFYWYKQSLKTFHLLLLIWPPHILKYYSSFQLYDLIRDRFDQGFDWIIFDPPFPLCHVC